MIALEQDDSQDRAVALICSARFALVTGGPGTGKTTCLRRALEQLADARVELAAPTGKAAKRMHEATGRDARTVHRLLEYKPGYGFTRNRDNPLQCDLVVVDEASMVDIELAAALFAAVGESTRIVLVGDADQLPPVGPGSPFADLVADTSIPCARLTQVHRSAAGSWVNRNAPRVLAGEALELGDTHDFRFARVEAPIDLLPTVRKALEADRSLQALIPQRTGVAGIDAANEALQRVLNDVPLEEGARTLQRQHYTLRAGDRVIQTRNDYELKVFNGEIGDIVDINGDGVLVEIPDGDGVRSVNFPHDKTQALELAYALTVHRSQGSEFDGVVCVVHSTHSFVLSRALLYTAITRTRGQVVIVGDDRGLSRALANEGKPKRNTTLVDRLHGELDEVVGDEP